MHVSVHECYNALYVCMCISTFILYRHVRISYSVRGVKLNNLNGFLCFYSYVSVFVAVFIWIRAYREHLEKGIGVHRLLIQLV